MLGCWRSPCGIRKGSLQPKESKIAAQYAQRTNSMCQAYMLSKVQLDSGTSRQRPDQRPDSNPETRQTARTEPQRPHHVTASEQLQRKRKEQQQRAQALTRALCNCSTFAELLTLYNERAEEFNAIHFSAVFSKLAEVCDPSAHGHRPLTRTERAEVRSAVCDRLLPHTGIKLMGFGPRQLATVLHSLARLGCSPPSFWLAEWLQLFARRLPSSPAPTSPLVSPPTTSPRPPSARPEPSRCSATDISQSMWALAMLQSTSPSSLPGTGMPRRHPNPTPSSPSSATPPQPPAPPCSAPQPLQPPASAGGTFAGPSLVWLDEVALALASVAPSCSPSDLSACLWAAATMAYRPPPAALEPLLARCMALMQATACTGARSKGAGSSSMNGRREVTLPESWRSRSGVTEVMEARELSTVLWSLAVLGYRPGQEWMAVACDAVHRLAGGAPCGRSRTEEVGTDVTAGPAATGELGLAVGAEGQERTLGRAGEARGSVQVRSGSGEAMREAVALPAEPGGDWWQEHLLAPAATGPSSIVVQGPSSMPLPTTAGDLLAVQRSYHIANTTIPAVTLTPVATHTLTPLDTRQATTCLWALAQLGHQPAPEALHQLVRHTCKQLAAANPQDLAMLAQALARLRYRPEPTSMQQLLLAMEAHMDAAGERELVMWIEPLVQLQLAAPEPWAVSYLQAVEARLEHVAAPALVGWLVSLSQLQVAEVSRCARQAGNVDSSSKSSSRAKLLPAPRDARVGRVGAAGNSRLALGSRRGSSSGTGDDRDAAPSSPWVVAVVPPRGPHGHVAGGQAGGGGGGEDRGVSEECGASAASAARFNVRMRGALDRSSRPAAVGVRVRPAAKLVTGRLFRSLALATYVRMSHMDVVLLCKCAWAMARLGLSARASWVHAVVKLTGEAMERGAAASPRAALWLVRLVWALSAIQHNTRQVTMLHQPQRPIVMVHVRGHGTGSSNGRAGLGGEARLAGAAASGSRPGGSLGKQHPLLCTQTRSRLVSRGWCSLLLRCVLPQLPSMTNLQLLLLVRGLVRLRAGPGRVRATQDLRAYCRRRVADTCGGEEVACDLTTSELLQWSSRGELDGGQGGGARGVGAVGGRRRAGWGGAGKRVVVRGRRRMGA